MPLLWPSFCWGTCAAVLSLCFALPSPVLPPSFCSFPRPCPLTSFLAIYFSPFLSPFLFPPLPVLTTRPLDFQVILVATSTKTMWPRGPMDKASAYGAGDCRSESCRGHFGKFVRICANPERRLRRLPAKADARQCKSHKPRCLVARLRALWRRCFAKTSCAVPAKASFCRRLWEWVTSSVSIDLSPTPQSSICTTRRRARDARPLAHSRHFSHAWAHLTTFNR